MQEDHQGEELLAVPRTVHAMHPSTLLPNVEVEILSSEVSPQRIDRDHAPRPFLKELLRVDLPGEEGGLAVVRKSLPPEEIAARGGYEGVVVFIHGYAQNRYTWHTRGRSLPNFVASLGYDTYNVDLRGQGRSRREFGAPMPHHPDEYIERDLPAVVSAAIWLSGCPRVVLVGHSLGGAVSYAVAPRLHEAGVLAGVVTIAAVFGFGTNQFVRQLCRFGSNVARTEPPGNLSIPLHLLGKPLIAPFMGLLDHSATSALPFHGWYPGTVEEDVLRQNLEEGLDQVTLGVTLALAEWAIEGYFHARDGRDYVEAFQRVHDVPVLILAGEKDVLLTPRDAEAAVRFSRSHDVTWRLFTEEHGGHGWGHLDIILGTDAPRFVWPEIETWLHRIETRWHSSE